MSASTLTSLPTQRRKVLTKHRPPKMARVSEEVVHLFILKSKNIFILTSFFSQSASTTTITTTTMTDASMQVLTVTLNMGKLDRFFILLFTLNSLILFPKNPNNKYYTYVRTYMYYSYVKM